MYYVVVHYADIDYNRINQIREKYDPTFGVINPHILLSVIARSVATKQSLDFKRVKRLLRRVYAELVSVLTMTFYLGIALLLS
jgi:hypothetical protein